MTLAPHIEVVEVGKDRMKNNNYIVVDRYTRQAVIVDPAWELDKLSQILANLQVSLSGVLVTHAHHDHIDLADEMATKYACPIWMSAIEVAESGFSAGHLVPIDDMPWEVGQMTIEPIHTPGHTQGCICFLIGDNLFTGDVLFAEGCGLCFDLRGAHDMYASLEKLKAELQPHTRIYPGHTYLKPPGQLFSDVLRRNIYLQFPDKDSFAAYRLRGGRSNEKVLDFS